MGGTEQGQVEIPAPLVKGLPRQQPMTPVGLKTSAQSLGFGETGALDDMEAQSCCQRFTERAESRLADQTVAVGHDIDRAHIRGQNKNVGNGRQGVSVDATGGAGQKKAMPGPLIKQAAVQR